MPPLSRYRRWSRWLPQGSVFSRAPAFRLVEHAHLVPCANACQLLRCVRQRRHGHEVVGARWGANLPEEMLDAARRVDADHATDPLAHFAMLCAVPRGTKAMWPGARTELASPVITSNGRITSFSSNSGASMTSPNPTSQDIFRARFFEELLAPTGADPTPNRAFWRKQLPGRSHRANRDSGSRRS